MKVKSITIKNFKTMTSLETNLESGITYVIGSNGAGKSTFVEGLFTCLKGRKYLPRQHRWQMIKSGASKCVLKCTLRDKIEEIRIERKITPKSVDLKIEKYNIETGKIIEEEMNQAYLDSLLSDFTHDPIAFSMLSAKEQANRLGIDTSQFDSEIRELKEKRLEQGRYVKKLKGSVENAEVIEKVEKVDINKLWIKKEKVLEWNRKQDGQKELLASLQGEHTRLENELQELKRQIAEKEKELETNLGKQLLIASPKSYQETTGIDTQINNAEETNRQYSLYQQYLSDKTEYEFEIEQKETIENKITEQKMLKSNHIKDSNLPFENITIDDEGGLLLDGRPFNSNFFSHSERIKIGSMLLVKSNPELEFLYIKDAKLLDDASLDKMTKLANQGYQIILEWVGKEKKGTNCILIKECKLVDSYEDEQEKTKPQSEILTW